MKPLDWIKWLSATAVAGATMAATAMGWAYSTFPTKDVFQIIIDRLDRIETLVNQILTK